MEEETSGENATKTLKFEKLSLNKLMQQQKDYLNKTKNSLKEKQELLVRLTTDEKPEKPVSFRQSNRLSRIMFGSTVR